MLRAKTGEFGSSWGQRKDQTSKFRNSRSSERERSSPPVTFSSSPAPEMKWKWSKIKMYRHGQNLRFTGFALCESSALKL